MRKIVLIEDDADLYALLKYNLEKEGFAMAGAQTGKGATELCRRERPDLILLEWTPAKHGEARRSSPAVPQSGSPRRALTARLPARRAPSAPHRTSPL